MLYKERTPKTNLRGSFFCVRFYLFLSLCMLLSLRKYVLVFVCAGEEGAGVGADRNDLAVVGAGKVDSGKNHLTRDAASLKAIKYARMVDNHPLQCRALVRHLADLRVVQPCFEDTVSFCFSVLDIYHVG